MRNRTRARKSSKKFFTKTAMRMNKRNRPKRVMRGGYRI